MRVFLLLVGYFNLYQVGCFEVAVLDDVLAPVGGKAEFVCSVEGLRGRLRDCLWVSPDKKEYNLGKKAFSDNEISVHVDSRRNECVLTIDPIQRKSSGFWECVITEDRVTVGKFAFLRIYESDSRTSFQMLLDDDEKIINAVKGDSAVLKCPTNSHTRFHGQRPSCRWLSPAGQTYNLVGYNGEIYDLSTLGIGLGGDIDAGECGLRLFNVDLLHSGKWRCTLLRTSRVDLGSESVSAEIELNVFRSARLNAEPTLQGFQRGDRNVRIRMNVSIGPDEKYTDLYWIIHRQHIIYEGETYCPTSKNECYTSSRRRKIMPSLYDVELTIDVLSSDDIDHPLVLVKDHRDTKGDDHIDIFRVPKNSDKLVGDDYDEVDANTQTTNRKRSRVKSASGQVHCRVGDDTIPVGDHVDFLDLCVRIKCTSTGSVEPISIPVEECRPRRRSRGESASLALPTF